MPSLLDQVGDLLRMDWPDYARFLDDNGVDVAEASGLFVHRLIEMASRGLDHQEPEPLATESTVQLVFEQIGRLQWRHGRDLTVLLTAYQVGARAAWREVSTIALEMRLSSEVLAALAEAVFVFVDQLSSASANGYVLEQSEAVAERERFRRELSDLLLSGRSDSVAVSNAAERARWELPGEGCVVLVDQSDGAARTVVDRLDALCLPIRTPILYGAIVPGPLGRDRRARLAEVLRGAKAVVGPVVPLAVLPASTRLPQVAMDLQRRGLLAGDPIFVNENLDTLIVHRDPRPINALRRQVLAPLADLAPATRERLTETLVAWLRHMGDRSAVADELFVHPQTVRYRLTQLRTHFGGALDSPRARAQMLLALEWGTSEED
ncbi:helix-turn-helix domain-containing protein [Aldersonia sp. NBC_00410]|uniref:PucR family transcriptional regulator n=1 Tax=Aldersonia sp. NBC_00410 TaxID=2975954 RepID=UPI00224F5768|nr:PucR family transcriptional regulator [Aldersonia sp. NBC_00410]MCX5043743.1 helix-turn-helix domain-containing protein [Aldersonia sp. NBC_00410]